MKENDNITKEEKVEFLEEFIDENKDSSDFEQFLRDELKKLS